MLQATLSFATVSAGHAGVRQANGRLTCACGLPPLLAHGLGAPGEVPLNHRADRPATVELAAIRDPAGTDPYPGWIPIRDGYLSGIQRVQVHGVRVGDHVALGKALQPRLSDEDVVAVRHVEPASAR